MTKTVKKITSEPSVTFHKSGRFIKMKANDIFAADVVREVESRQIVPCMRKESYYSAKGTAEIPKDERKIEIWRWLVVGIEKHPIVSILASYGVKTHFAESLKNYVAKEARRQELENTPYPTATIETDVNLFDRCAEGTVLLCTKDFGKTAAGGAIFRKGSRYIVLASGEEGSDVVVISTHILTSGSSISLTGNAAKYSWTMFSEPIEEYFSDSENINLGKNLVQKYPDRVKKARKDLKAKGLALYEHVFEDAAMMSLKRGVMNAYPMRMAKTSCAIAVAELSQSKKVLAVAPGNARLFWTKEFTRLGFKEGKDFAEVRSLDEINPDIKYHLITYTWLSLSKDTTYKARKDWKNILKPSSRTISKQKPGITWKEKEEIEIQLTNDCPHCNKPMERLQRLPNGNPDVTPNGKLIWTTKRGYICRNKSCKWKNNNRDVKAAWSDKKQVSHVGGYVDYELAKHANCEDTRVKGRMCPECHVADGVWTPPRYKRIKKKFTHVILDEAHATKDPSTFTSTAALNMRARRRQALTGTPMSNSAMDIYYPLHWTCNAPSVGFPYFDSEGFKEFDDRFCDAISLEKPVGTETNAQGQVTQVTKTVRKRVPFLKNAPDFWRFIAPKMIRRSYSDPLFVKTLTANGRSMPKSDIKKIACPMDHLQAAIMLASIKDFKGTFSKLQKEASKKGTQINPTLVISQMTTMRTAATCPELLNTKFGTKIYEGPAGGGKMPFIKGIVENRIDKGGKVLILSDFVQMQATVNKALKPYGTICFNTAWDDDARREAFDKFQEDPEAKIFIAGTRAIREGVDLSAADTVICCDLLWSPAFQTQAWSRIMAPSTRERTCEIYLMLSANSLDEHIFNVFYSKMIAAEQALDRKVLNRKAQQIDIQWFVDRVLEEEKYISDYLRDAGEATMIVADLDLSQFEDRMV